MDSVIPIFLQHWLLDYRYELLFVLAIIEGPVVMTFAGFWLTLGYFEFWPVYAVLMAGDLVADAAWYAVGYHAGRPFIQRFGKFFSITEASIKKVEEIFHRHRNTILFSSKITMGFGFAMVTLLVAGMSRIPFRTYIVFNAAGQFIWTGILLAVGYFFGSLYIQFNAGLHRAAIVAGLIIVILLLLGFGKYLKNRNLEHDT